MESALRENLNRKQSIFPFKKGKGIVLERVIILILERALSTHFETRHLCYIYIYIYLSFVYIYIYLIQLLRESHAAHAKTTTGQIRSDPAESQARNLCHPDERISDEEQIVGAQRGPQSYSENVDKVQLARAHQFSKRTKSRTSKKYKIEVQVDLKRR